MRTAPELARQIIQHANDGYHHQRPGYPEYPPFELTPWGDRLKWSAYVQKVAELVIAEELKERGASSGRQGSARRNRER